MNYTPQPTEIPGQNREPQYGILKTLTLLTFIGCALSYVLLLQFIVGWKDHNKQLAEIEKQRDKIESSAIAERMLDALADMMQKDYDNRYLLAGNTAIFTSLCLLGAMRMRKLQKSGYPIYVIGELAPIIVMVAATGFSLIGLVVAGFSALAAIVFVILYTTQRKSLIYP